MGSLGEDSTPIAAFTTISLQRLEANDNAEKQKMHNACVADGFFYLDISHLEMLNDDWAETLRVMNAYFAQDLDTKMKDCLQSDIVGYAQFLQALHSLYARHLTKLSRDLRVVGSSRARQKCTIHWSNGLRS